MKLIIKSSIALGFVVAGIFVFSTAETQATGLTAAEMSSPRSLFVQNCARCHGSNGRSETKEGRRLEADDLTTSDAKDLSEARVKRVITNGRGKMPGFGKKLTAAQIAQIAGYIRSL